jgi:predicted carbohydrate-binding protein with CBM5 and CBM33 domain
LGWFKDVIFVFYKDKEMALLPVKTLAVLVALAPVGAMSIHSAAASGYVSSPAARAHLCQTGENQNCGDFAAFQPALIQSATTATGFPPSAIASGGLDRYQALDSESATRWQKTSIAGGKLDISWQITSPSTITGWKYYITQPNWQHTLDSKHRLTTASFAAAPFCQASGDETKIQQGIITHHCQLPPREGYQLIYAVADQANGQSLYNIIDVKVAKSAGQVAPAELVNWQKEIATIDMPIAVKAGDVVRARFFGADEEPNLETKVTIKAGEETRWSVILAEAINGQHADIRAGVRSTEGDVTPAQHKINNIYVAEDSYLTSAVISVN